MSVADQRNDSFPPLVDKAIVLTGPTGSGKSLVAVELAQRVDAEIISLDSIAVYREMDIGTAKPTPSDRRRVTHHLLDIADPTEDFSVARYLQAAHQVVDEIDRRGRQVIFVGGSPMFLKGVLRGFDPGPPADWDFRRSVEAELQQHGIEALRRRLEQVDPLAAHKIAPTDARRMIRALEVAYQTGTPISHRQVQFEYSRPPDSCNVFSMEWPRAALHQRINDRVEQMYARHLIDEVRGLLDRHGQLSRTASQAVGYREIIAALGQGDDPLSTQEKVAAHTRQMARRQETWFRSFSEIRRIAAAEPLDAVAVAAEIESLLV